jgi:hypothetical protein
MIGIGMGKEKRDKQYFHVIGVPEAAYVTLTLFIGSIWITRNREPYPKK